MAKVEELDRQETHLWKVCSGSGLLDEGTQARIIFLNAALLLLTSK